MRTILTGLEAARCRLLARRRWGLGTRGWGGYGERGLQEISATVGPRSSQSGGGAKPSILLTEAEDLQAAAGFRAAARVLSLNHAA